MEIVGIHPNDFGTLNGHPNKIPTTSQQYPNRRCSTKLPRFSCMMASLSCCCLSKLSENCFQEGHLALFELFCRKAALNHISHQLWWHSVCQKLYFKLQAACWYCWDCHHNRKLFTGIWAPSYFCGPSVLWWASLQKCTAAWHIYSHSIAISFLIEGDAIL